jgi:hypothetical protein
MNENGRVLTMANSRFDNLFSKKSGEIPEWMAIRDADNKRRKDNEARLRAARLARDKGEASEKKATAPVRRKGSRSRQTAG